MLTQEDRAKLAEVLGVLGLPARFTGDRLATFQYGIDVTVEAMASRVSLDPEPEKPEDEKPGDPPGR